MSAEYERADFEMNAPPGLEEVPSGVGAGAVSPVGPGDGAEGAAESAGCAMPPGPRWRRWVDLLGIRYLHCRTADEGDLYLTSFGVPFEAQLQPHNWLERGWFERHRQRLHGTSVVYRLPTRAVAGHSLDLVIKWSRVGEDVPGGTMNVDHFINADFNTPFEEFALLTELRDGGYGPPGFRVRTQRPLGIYVPSERLQLWQTGRSESKIAAKIAKHPGVELDILRQYVLIYEWVKGVDLVEAFSRSHEDAEERDRLLGSATSLVIHELAHKGFRVADMKPAHIIVRQHEDGSLARDRTGQIIYALVDHELLQRTPEHEEAVRQSHRAHYLEHMARRFESRAEKPLPPHLDAVNILGVDYIYGRSESTGGRLWVAGKDPDLFNYFLPERWRRTPAESLSPYAQVFRTRTKDNINLVWRVSRMGEVPDSSGGEERLESVRELGFNSPFEEFAMANDLNSRGFRTVFLRAIYMTGRKVERSGVGDLRRHERLARIRTPDGEPLLLPDHDYITIWGFWNGADKLVVGHRGPASRGLDAESACFEGIINDETLADLIYLTQSRLAHRGYEHLDLRPNHVLVSVNERRELVRDSTGRPELRLCNFELLRRIPE
ncbi:MAG: hypothetical protein H7A46_10045 [Verrucomicrobiales bacterium]|nr:hypothetical protein [Verrucomicrobiales bacterium]